MNDFAIQLFKYGVKLVLKKTQMLGSNEEFIHAHMKTIKQSITEQPLVIWPKDILFLQMLILMKGVRKGLPMDRAVWFYTPFLSPIKLIEIRNPKNKTKTFVSYRQ